MLFPEFISTEFSQQLDTAYPASISDPVFRRFIMYLCFGSYRDKNYRYLIVSQQLCAMIEHRPLTGRYCAKTFLTRMQSLLPDFQFSGWQKDGFQHEKIDNLGEYDYTRVVEVDGLSDAFKKQVELEKNSTLDIHQKIHYRTGSKYSERNRTYILHQEAEQAKDINEIINKVELQEAFLEYFNNLPLQTFTNVIRDNFNSALNVWKQFEFVNADTKQHNLNLLKAIQQQPKPFYQAVPNCRRLYAIGNAIPYLKKEIRKELTKGWIEFDLVNCHLAIIAKDWHIPSVSQLLSEGSIWLYLAPHYDIARYKPILKKALYALVYGDSQAEIKRKFQLANLPNRNRFWKIPIIKDIYQARQQQLNFIKGCASRDCFGEEIPYHRYLHKTWDKKENREKEYYTDNGRSILAQQAYAVELKLLQPIVAYSARSKYICVISLYQFDGFSMVCKQKSRQQTHINKMCKILNTHIKELGYNTTVEYTIN